MGHFDLFLTPPFVCAAKMAPSSRPQIRRRRQFPEPLLVDLQFGVREIYYVADPPQLSHTTITNLKGTSSAQVRSRVLQALSPLIP